MFRQCRECSKLSLKGKLRGKTARTIQPTSPARTRFAPSPTGFLHLGSLRTALYNYLLAKSTGGQFLLRLEDTDRTRLVEGAEKNIYDSLKWCGLTVDEGPIEGGEYGPYRQSDRGEIYQKYAHELVEKGLAYYCKCSKERLADLRQSAMKLKPPTTVTYDRKCLHEHVNEGSIIRFRSPEKYSSFTDLIHGNLNLQPQYNAEDRRYDDFVILKSDGLPTYHFANVVDDHLMKITHVVRGEEWLTSTPKHIALYEAFGWTPPKYIHIPLLTSLEDKKLSKRSGDIGVLSMKSNGILPEALTNFCALFGWSPARETPGVSTSETMSLSDLAAKFSLDSLTRGNAKVSDNKLFFFNKHFLQLRIADPEKLDELVNDYFPVFDKFTNHAYDQEYLKKTIVALGPSLTTVNDIESLHGYIFKPLDHTTLAKSHLPPGAREILTEISKLDLDFETNATTVLEKFSNLKKKDVYQTVRFALSGGVSGVTIPVLIDLLGEQEYARRVNSAIQSLDL